MSGHAFMIGCHSGKVVAFAVRAKKCIKCTRAKKKCVIPEAHKCTANHKGSSGSMEAAAAALELTTDIFDKLNGHIFI